MKFVQQSLIKFYRWRHEADSISLGGIQQKPRRLLVTLPMSQELSIMCGGIIGHLRDSFDSKELQFTYISFPAGKLHEFTKGYKVHTPKIDQRPKHGLPNKAYIAAIAEFKPDLAIDLEPTPDPYNSIIVLKSGAGARIGMERGIGLPFYNLELRSPANGSVRDRFESMHGFLTGFLNWGSTDAERNRRSAV